MVKIMGQCYDHNFLRLLTIFWRKYLKNHNIDNEKRRLPFVRKIISTQLLFALHVCTVYFLRHILETS
jgi:hypothetical protein